MPTPILDPGSRPGRRHRPRRDLLPVRHFHFHLWRPEIQVGWDEAITLNRIIFPYLFFVGLAALGMGILNSFHHFGLPASTTVLLNISIITFSTAMVWRYFPSPAVSLAVGVLVGGALQFLILVPQMVRRGMRFDFGMSFRIPGFAV